MLSNPDEGAIALLSKRSHAANISSRSTRTETYPWHSPCEENSNMHPEGLQWAKGGTRHMCINALPHVRGEARLPHSRREGALGSQVPARLPHSMIRRGALDGLSVDPKSHNQHTNYQKAPMAPPSNSARELLKLKGARFGRRHCVDTTPAARGSGERPTPLRHLRRMRLSLREVLHTPVAVVCRRRA